MPTLLSVSTRALLLKLSALIILLQLMAVIVAKEPIENDVAASLRPVAILPWDIYEIYEDR